MATYPTQDVATQAELDAHEANIANPHSVTPAQIGTATTTTEGVVEFATTAEVDTGTDATRAITPDALNGSAPAIAATNITGLVAPASIGSRWSEPTMVGGLVRNVHNLGAVADIISTPGDATWVNSGSLTSAAIASSQIQIDHDASTQDDFWDAAFTGPWMYWPIDRIDRPDGEWILIEAHVSTADTPQDFEFGGLVVSVNSDTPTGEVVWHALGGNGGTKVTTGEVGVGTTIAAATSFAVGVSLRLGVAPNGDVYTWMVDGDTSPTSLADWGTATVLSSVIPATTTTVRVGLLNVANKASPNGIRFDFKELAIRASNILTL